MNWHVSCKCQLRELKSVEKEALMASGNTNRLRILILLSLALGFFLGRKAVAPKKTAE